jgi:hypothetical protein
MNPEAHQEDGHEFAQLSQNTDQDPMQGTLTRGEGRLSTVDLLVKVACFVTKVRHNSNKKMS